RDSQGRGDRFGAVDVGEDHVPSLFDPIESDKLPLGGERRLLRDFDVGGKAAFADLGATAGGQRGFGGRGLDLAHRAGRQAAVVEAALTVDRDLDLLQLRRGRAVGGRGATAYADRDR